MNESQVYGGHAKISVGENWELFYAKNNLTSIKGMFRYY